MYLQKTLDNYNFPTSLVWDENDRKQMMNLQCAGEENGGDRYGFEKHLTNAYIFLIINPYISY